MWLGYRRVSRVGGREHLISPEIQSSRIDSYAEGRGMDVEMLDPELDVSGGKVVRPILEVAIERVERGEAEGIIVAQLDRLSRMDIVDALHVIERIEAAGGGVVAVAENVDPSTASGRFARNVFLSMAQHQLDNYKLGFATAKRQAVVRGIWPVHSVPRGYVKGPDRGLLPGPDAPLVRRAFEVRAKGGSWSQVADVVGLGISGAGKLVRNRVYLGEIRLTVEGEVVVNRDAHEPIVPRDLWEAAQFTMPGPPRGTKPYLLSRLIRCGHCSRTMSPGEGIYRCLKRSVAGTCPSPPTIKASMVEEHVEAIVLSHLTGAVRGSAKQVGLSEQAELEQAEAELLAFQEATSALGDPSHFAAGLSQRVEAVERAAAALGRVRGAAVAEVPFALSRDAYLSLDVRGRRHVLGSAIGVVWVWKGRGLDRVAVVERGFEPAQLSGPGVSVPLVAVDRDRLVGEVGMAEVEGAE